MSTAPNSNAAQNRIDNARLELHRLQVKINRSTQLTIIVAILLMGALGGYLYYGFRMWDYVTEPKNLVNYLGVKLDDMIPGAKKSLEDEIEKSSPQWAEHLSEKMLASVPDARKKVEAFVLEQMEATIQKAHLVTEKGFRTFLQKNRPMLEKQYTDLAANKEVSKRALEVALDDDIKVDLQGDVLEILNTLKNANKTFTKIRVGENLTEDEKLERRVWGLFRRLLNEPIRIDLDPQNILRP